MADRPSKIEVVVDAKNNATAALRGAGNEIEALVKRAKKATGEESALGNLGKVLRGAGAIAGVTLAAHEFGELGKSVNEVSQMLSRGAGFDELAEHIAKGLPVLGDMYTAVENIGEAALRSAGALKTIEIKGSGKPFNNPDPDFQDRVRDITFNQTDEVEKRIADMKTLAESGVDIGVTTHVNADEKFRADMDRIRTERMELMKALDSSGTAPDSPDYKSAEKAIDELIAKKRKLAATDRDLAPQRAANALLKQNIDLLNGLRDATRDANVAAQNPNDEPGLLKIKQQIVSRRDDVAKLEGPVLADMQIVSQLREAETLYAESQRAIKAADEATNKFSRPIGGVFNDAALKDEIADLAQLADLGSSIADHEVKRLQHNRDLEEQIRSLKNEEKNLNQTVEERAATEEKIKKLQAREVPDTDKPDAVRRRAVEETIKQSDLRRRAGQGDEGAANELDRQRRNQDLDDQIEKLEEIRRTEVLTAEQRKWIEEEIKKLRDDERKPIPPKGMGAGFAPNSGEGLVGAVFAARQERLSREANEPADALEPPRSTIVRRPTTDPGLAAFQADEKKRRDRVLSEKADTWIVKMFGTTPAPRAIDTREPTDRMQGVVEEITKAARESAAILAKLPSQLVETPKPLQPFGIPTNNAAVPSGGGTDAAERQTIDEVRRTVSRVSDLPPFQFDFKVAGNQIVDAVSEALRAGSDKTDRVGLFTPTPRDPEPAAATSGQSSSSSASKPVTIDNKEVAAIVGKLLPAIDTLSRAVDSLNRRSAKPALP